MKTKLSILLCTFTLALAACGGNSQPAAKDPAPTTKPADKAPAPTQAAASGPVGVKSVTLHKDNGSGKIGDEVKTFTDGDKVLYFEVELDKIVTNTKMRMDFTGVNTSTGKDQKIGSVEGSLLVANSLSFMVPVTGKLPIGQYRGGLFLGETKLKDIDFTVEPAGGPTPIKAGAVTLKRDNGKGEPGDVVTAFKPTDKKLHFEIETTGANVKPAQVKWLYRTASAAEPLTVNTEVILSDSTLSGFLEWNDAAPVAKYTGEVLVNDKSIKTFDFEVIGDPPVAKVPAAGAPGKFAATKTFTAKTNLLQVSAPADWAFTDTSAPDEASLEFLAPDNTGYYQVTAFKVKTAPAGAELLDRLNSYLDGTYKTDDSYKGQPATKQDDGSGKKLYNLDVKLTDGKVHPFLGSASMVVGNGVMVIRRIIVERSLVPGNIETLNTMSDYLKIAGADGSGAAAPAAAASAPIAMDDIGPYNHPSGAFGISVPKAWKVLDESADGSVIVNFVEPGARAFYGVEAFKTQDGAPVTQEALKSALALYFTKAFGDKPGLKQDTIQFPSEGVASLTFSWEMPIQGKPTTMVGAVYLVRQGSAVSFLRSAAPSDDVKRLLDGFNTVGYSYRVNPAKLP